MNAALAQSYVEDYLEREFNPNRFHPYAEDVELEALDGTLLEAKLYTAGLAEYHEPDVNYACNTGDYSAEVEWEDEDGIHAAQFSGTINPGCTTTTGHLTNYNGDSRFSRIFNY